MQILRILPNLFRSHLEQEANTVTFKLSHAERKLTALVKSPLTFQASWKQGHRSKETVPGMWTSKVTLLTTVAWHFSSQAHSFLSWMGSWGEVGMRPQVPSAYCEYNILLHIPWMWIESETSCLYVCLCMCVYMWVMYKYRYRYKCPAIRTFECLLSTKSFNSHNPTVAVWGIVIITMLKTSQYPVERVTNLFKNTGRTWRTQAVHGKPRHLDLSLHFQLLLLLTVIPKSPIR